MFLDFYRIFTSYITVEFWMPRLVIPAELQTDADWEKVPSAGGS
jgi:hypothetical protein